MNTRRNLAKLAILGTAMPGVAMAQAPPSVPRNRTLIVSAITDAPVYRAHGIANPYAINIEDFRGSVVNTFEPLFYYNSNRDELIPWLATGYEPNADWTSYAISLRPGASWSDGRPFTADDIVFTLELLMENGKGRGDLVQSANVAAAVKAVVRTGPLALRIDLNQPDPRFPFRFLISHFDVGLHWLPAHIWREASDPAAFRNFDLARGWPVTTGAWSVTRFNENQVFMDRRDDWWAAKAGLAPLPAMQRIVTFPGGTRDRLAQLIVTNQVDLVNDLQIASILRQIIGQNPRITTFSGRNPPFGAKDWWPTSLYFNHKSGKWADVHLRRAINHYIDRRQVIEFAHGGAAEPTIGPFPGFGSLRPYIELIEPIAARHGIGVHDRAKGDENMRLAGYARNAAGIWSKDDRPLTAVIEAVPIMNAIGPIVAQQLKNAGIDASYRSTPDSRAVMRDGRYDLTLFGHRGSIFDPYDTLEMYHSRNAFEVGRPTLFPARWANAEYDRFVDQAAQLPPRHPRLRELVVGAMEIWMREAVEAPIAEWYHRIPMNQTYWTGWPSADDPYMQPTFWYTSGTFGYVLPRLRPAG